MTVALGGRLLAMGTERHGRLLYSTPRLPKLLGSGLVRSRAVPPGGALLVGLCGPAGMALLTGPDLADQPSTAAYALVRMAGFVAMVLYGGGWVWLGESLWRR